MRALCLIICLAWCCTATADVYENGEYGFRIDPGGADVASGGAMGDDVFGMVVNAAAGWQVRVRVAPVASSTTTLDIQKQVLERIADDPIYTVREHLDEEFSGKACHGIAVDYDYNGTPYRIVARFVVANDLRYIVQSSARSSDFEGHETAIDAVLKTFEILPLPEGKRRDHRLDGLTAKCGSEVEWEPRWQTAAERARREGKLVFVTARYYPGFDISDSLSTGALFDENILRLIEERFVPLRLEKGDDVPFRSYERYGLGPSTFGQAILLATSEGEIVAETFTADAISVDEFLRGALAVHRGNTAEVPEDATPLERARHHFDRGELADAEKTLANASGVEELRLRAALHRRLRHGPEALADLRKIRRLHPERAPADLIVDEGEILTRIGKTDEGLMLLRKFVADHPDHERVAEAKYWIGSIDIATGEGDRGRKLLEEVIERHFDDRWAWKSAAALTSTALKLGLKVRLTWPEERALAELRTPPREKPADRTVAERDAIRYLLDHQLADGTWMYPSNFGAADDSPPSPIADAVSAMVAASLVPHRAWDGVDAALERAVKGVEEARRRARDEGELLHFMDYWVWAKTYQLHFACRCIERGVGPVDELRALAQELVEEIAARQRVSGGWSYYLKRDLSANANDAQSISFVTAPIALILMAARDVGLDVADETIDKALECLLAMRNENGSFDYMGGIGSRNGSTGQGGAAGRGPLCELALYRGGRASLDDVRRALRIFMEQREGLAREQGKNLMHAGPEAQGSHYLLFDYAYTAAAVGALPADEHDEYRQALVELIDAARYEGGGYMDNPSMGRACGTALALMALEALRPSFD